MSRRAAANALLSAGGIALLVWQVHNIGLDKVEDGLTRVGWGFAAILAISFARYVLRSSAWMTLMRDRAPLGRALAATLAGDALGNLTPLGLVASEPAKAIYLAESGGADRALAALTAENFFYSVSVAIYIIIGAAAMFVVFPAVPAAIRASAVATLAAMAAVLAGAGWIAWQKPAMASAALARIPIAALERVVLRVRAFEEHTYGSTGHEGARLGRLAATEFVFHVFSLAEAWVTLWLISGVSAPAAALVFDALNRVINIVFKMIPMRLGVDEVTASGMATAIGIRPDVGLVLALVRKVRLFAWAGVGMGIYASGAATKSRALKK